MSKKKGKKKRVKKKSEKKKQKKLTRTDWFQSSSGRKMRMICSGI